MNIKRLIYTYIIVLEWIEGNEFDNSERVIIAGNILQGCIINYLFRNTTKKVYLCDIREFDKSYRHYSKTKWIVCQDEKVEKHFYQKADIIILPRI